MHLSGAGIVAPVKGCRRNQPKEQGTNIVERLDVVLHGLPEVVDDWLKKIEALFSQIDLGEQAVLILKAAAGLGSYESRVVGGRIELLGRGSMDLKRGGLGVAVYLERLNYWEGETIQVPLSNPHGTDVINGLVLDNQYSLVDGKVNFAIISGDDVEGEIPAPATIKIKNSELPPTAWLSDIILSQDVVNNLQAGDHWVEGGHADSVWNYGAVMEPAASGGMFVLVEWFIPDATQLISWGINSERAARFAGQLVRPVMRLHTEVASSDYWIRCKVKQGEALEYSRWQKIKPRVKMQILAALHVPPKDLKSAEMFGVMFALEIQRNVSGSHSLAIDDIDLFPMDGYRHYSPLGDSGLSPSSTLVDESDQDLIYSISGDAQLRNLTHQATGKGIWLMPGKDQTIRIKFDNQNRNCDPNQRISLQMSYRPRRINL